MEVRTRKPAPCSMPRSRPTRNPARTASICPTRDWRWRTGIFCAAISTRHPRCSIASKRPAPRATTRFAHAPQSCVRGSRRSKTRLTPRHATTSAPFASCATNSARTTRNPRATACSTRAACAPAGAVPKLPRWKRNCNRSSMPRSRPIRRSVAKFFPPIRSTGQARLADERLRLRGEFRILHRHVQCRLDAAELVAAVEARTLEAIGEYGAFAEQRFYRIGELDLAAGTRLGLFEQLEDARRQHVAADDGEVRRRDVGLRLLDDEF